MGTLKTYKEFRKINESEDYKRSITGLGKFGMLDYTELPNEVKQACKEAGLKYNTTWTSLDGFGSKNYTNMYKDDDSLQVTIGMTMDDNDQFSKNANVSIYAESGYNNLGFTLLDTYDNYDRVLSFLKNFHQIVDPINKKLLDPNKSWNSSDFIQADIEKILKDYNIKGDGLIIH